MSKAIVLKFMLACMFGIFVKNVSNAESTVVFHDSFEAYTEFAQDWIDSTVDADPQLPSVGEAWVIEEPAAARLQVTKLCHHCGTYPGSSPGPNSGEKFLHWYYSGCRAYAPISASNKTLIQTKGGAVVEFYYYNVTLSGWAGTGSDFEVSGVSTAGSPAEESFKLRFINPQSVDIPESPIEYYDSLGVRHEIGINHTNDYYNHVVITLNFLTNKYTVSVNGNTSAEIDFVSSQASIGAVLFESISYDRGGLDDLTITAEDAPVPAGVYISTESLQTEEQGPVSGQYNITLSGNPTATVNVTIHPNNAGVKLNTQAAGADLILSYTVGGAMTKTVTVTPIDDTAAQGIHYTVLSHTSQSTDTRFNKSVGTLPIVDVTILDNDSFVDDWGGARKSSELFGDKYEADELMSPIGTMTGTSVETNDTHSVGDGLATCFNTFIQSKYGANASIFNNTDGFAIEFKARVVDDANVGPSGVAMVLVSAAGGSEAAAQFYVKPGSLVWEGSQTITSLDATQMHTYRLVKVGGQLNYAIFVDGKYVSTWKGNYAYGDAFYMGRVGGSQSGTAIYDYIRFDRTGSSAPLLPAIMVQSYNGHQLSVSELGETQDSYLVGLTSNPTSSVSVTVGTTSTDICLNGQNPGVPVVLTFNPTGGSSAPAPQRVIIQAVDNGVPNLNPYQATITHVAASSDTLFNNVSIDNMVVTIVDDEAHCGDAGTQYWSSDFNHDCEVDFEDLLVMVSQWIRCSSPADPINCSLQ